MMITPPSRYPDLFAVLNVLISTPVFVLTWLWSIKCGVEVGWALRGLGSISSVSKSLKEDANVATSIGHPSESTVETAEYSNS
jgi:alpha-1,3-glucosyltransferase